MAGGSERIKELRYQVMLALYLPILLYAATTIDIENADQTVAVRNVSPVVYGTQNVVLGQEYSAYAYLAAVPQEGTTKQGANIELKVNQDGMKVLDNRQLVMDTGALLEKGQDTRTVEYKGTIEYSTLEGGVKSLPYNGSFTVRRPELVATSVAAQSLYRQTLNQIRIDVPGLENQPLRLEYGNTSVDGRTIQLSPAGDNVTVSAYLQRQGQDDVYLGDKSFGVIDPPRPEIRVLDAQGNPLISGQSFPAARPLINVNVVADQEFAKSYPQDARYRVGQVQVSIRRGLGVSERIGTFNVPSDGRINFRTFSEYRSADPEREDQIILELQDVVRINHAGQAIPVDLSDASRSYSFILS
ncbi:GldM family protein [Salisaeta longa]|uniref:GldM family protein n=1 Tax=Salisaeta longa TaxID=503170 RepID=UPI0004256161|nr:GldM family protein [Salisaeta longa]